MCLMTIKQAAEKFGVSEKTIMRWVKDKALPHARPGKKIFFVDEKLDEWMAQQVKSNTVHPCQKGTY